MAKGKGGGAPRGNKNAAGEHKVMYRIPTKGSAALAKVRGGAGTHAALGAATIVGGALVTAAATGAVYGATESKGAARATTHIGGVTTGWLAARHTNTAIALHHNKKVFDSLSPTVQKKLKSEMASLGLTKYGQNKKK
jgi:hypothetical protein